MWIFFLAYIIFYPKTIAPYLNHTDQELLLLMRKGRREAFHEIYERYWKKLYLTAAKRIRSTDDAKDLVQDLFFSIWMKRETLSVTTSLSAYLFTAIKYKIINYIEANIVKEDYLNSLDKAAAFGYDDSTGDQIARDDIESFLQAGIDGLSPRVKEVFELSRKEHLSIQEIAEKLQVSHQTVKNQITTALKTLRLHLYSGTDKVKS